MTTEARTFHPAAAWLWAFTSLICWFSSFALALPIAGRTPEVAGVRTDLAVVVALNGVASLVSVELLGRALLGRQLRRSGAAVVMAVIGIVLAIGVEITLHEWAEARFGYYDSDFIWLTAGLSPTVIVTAVSLYGVLVAPRGAIAPPLVGLAFAAGGVCLIFASNVGGLADGIDSHSWPLALMIGLSAAYALAAASIGAWRAIDC